ncbi:MAG: hypothetical protein AB7P99_00955 [Vicinamibacterales bacterium]
MGRVFAFLFALAVGGAPVMVQICEIHCTTPEAHACHQVGTGERGARLDGPAHACAHLEALPEAGSRMAQVEMPALMPMAQAEAPDPTLVTSPVPFDSSPPPSPVPLALRTPLRV